MVPLDIASFASILFGNGFVNLKGLGLFVSGGAFGKIRDSHSLGNKGERL